MQIETMQVEHGEEWTHIYVKGQEYISLKRFAEMKIETFEEMKLLIDKVRELAQENEALKVLLKEQL